MKICIDPGHGGSDPGTTAAGIKEKDITLDISLYMKERMEMLGFEVIMTRTSDTTLRWHERAEFVKKSGARLCISNHINAGGGQGAETIYSIHSDGRLAQLILDELGKAGMKKRRAFSKKSSLYPGRDYYYMHRKTGPVETVIVEYGFIDREEDRKKLIDTAFRNKLAEGVIKAVCTYLEIEYKNPDCNSCDNSNTVKIINAEIPPFLKEGKTCIQLRTLVEALGGKIDWYDKTQTIVCIINDKKLIMQIGNPQIKIINFQKNQR